MARRRRRQVTLFELMVWVAVAGGVIGYFLHDPERREIALGLFVCFSPLLAVPVAMMMNRWDREDADAGERPEDSAD